MKPPGEESTVYNIVDHRDVRKHMLEVIGLFKSYTGELYHWKEERGKEDGRNRTKECD